MKLVLDKDPHYAPGGYLLCLVTREYEVNGEERVEWNRRDEETTILYQMDWDFPRLAQLFGWNGLLCGETDGTSMCKCHPRKTVSQYIIEATEFLDSKVGEIIEISW